MNINVFSAETAEELFENMGSNAFDFVSLHCNANIPYRAIQMRSHKSKLHVATSCLGAMSNHGVSKGLTAFAINDPDGAYGTALSTVKTDFRAAAALATQDALKQADRLGEIPDMVWISATPGAEEEALTGVEDIVGNDVPIIGGSAADNTVSGDWYVGDGTNHVSEGIVVSVMFPSRPVSFAYQNGYSPTAKTGMITKVSGRQVLEIDGAPAMDVYSAWTENSVPSCGPDEDQTAILSESTMWPLGRKSVEVGDVPFYLLAHPAVAQKNGAMDLFANVEEGETLTLMTGTKQSLVDRAGRVAALARQKSETPETTPAGALMIYCGGCMLSVQEHLGDVVSGVDKALNGASFLGAFTFGEQGPLIRGGNRHGNLMISCIVFG